MISQWMGDSRKLILSFHTVGVLPYLIKALIRIVTRWLVALSYITSREKVPYLQLPLCADRGRLQFRFGLRWLTIVGKIFDRGLKNVAEKQLGKSETGGRGKRRPGEKHNETIVLGTYVITITRDKSLGKMFQIALWLLVGLLFIWLLLGYVSRAVDAVREIIFPIIDSKPVDLRAKFGSWAVVTGSTDGIGKAYAKELATRGINLVLISRTLEKLEKTRNEILEENPTIEVKVIAADFGKGREIFAKLAEQLKDIPVGILVNNVGMMYDYPMYVGEVPEDVLWNMINVNIGATTMMTRMVIGEMQKRGKGAIVNVASGSELQPLPLMTVYAASKVYVRSFTEALRAEYSRFGLTIQHLAPFYVNTKMNAYSDRLQMTSILIPDAKTYAKNAISTLGKLNSSTGYWSHGIQKIIMLIAPEDIRMKIGLFLNSSFRQNYLKQKTNVN